MAKKYKVVFTSEAADELQKIVEYLEEEGPIKQLSK